MPIMIMSSITRIAIPMMIGMIVPSRYASRARRRYWSPSCTKSRTERARRGAAGSTTRTPLNLFRLLQAIPTDVLASTLNRLLEAPVASEVTAEALEILREFFGAPRSSGCVMVVRATEGLEDPGLSRCHARFWRVPFSRRSERERAKVAEVLKAIAVAPIPSPPGADQDERCVRDTSELEPRGDGETT